MIYPGHDVTRGGKLPQEFNTVVEIPFGSSVKYELDKTSRAGTPGSPPVTLDR
jgi:inorganic pyrophosphatase